MALLYNSLDFPNDIYRAQTFTLTQYFVTPNPLYS